MKAFFKFIGVIAIGITLYLIYRDTPPSVTSTKSDNVKPVPKIASPKKAMKSVLDESTHHDKVKHDDNNHSHSNTEETEHQHSIPKDIHTKLCLPDNTVFECRIDIETDYSSQLTNENGNLLTDEVGVILNSVNFSDVLLDMSNKKISSESFERENKYNDELRELTSEYDVKSDGVYCNDNSCGMSVNSESQEELDKFNKHFFSDTAKGNLFIAQMPAVYGQNFNRKIMFFPNNLNPINTRR